MALSATYNGDLSRLILAGTALGASATYAVFDWTVNAVKYTTVRGGGHVTVATQLASVSEFEFPLDQAVTYRVRSYNGSNVLQQTFTTTVTQTLEQPWLKSVERPFLNRPVEASEASDIKYTARAGIFPVIGRSYPIGVTDSFALKTYDLTLTTMEASDAADLRILVTSGDTMFLHSTGDCGAPGGYYVIGDITEGRQGMPWARRWFTLPLTEVAAPSADVVGAIGTWATVVATYATWADVIAAKASWSELATLVGDPSEVVVP